MLELVEFDIEDEEDDEIEVGSISGYVCSLSDNNWENYLNARNKCNHVTNLKQTNAEKIGIVGSMFVEDEFRNCGYGTELLNCAMDRMEFLEADIIILIADNLEDNNFSLVEWYISKGFEVLDTEEKELPLMIYKNKNK